MHIPGRRSCCGISCIFQVELADVGYYAYSRQKQLLLDVIYISDRISWCWLLCILQLESGHVKYSLLSFSNQYNQNSTKISTKLHFIVLIKCVSQYRVLTVLVCGNPPRSFRYKCKDRHERSKAPVRKGVGSNPTAVKYF